jgi:hypothetical protein
MAIWRATLLRVAFESPSVRVRKIGAIPGALSIGVRVAKTTNAFCSRSVMSGAVMKGESYQRWLVKGVAWKSQRRSLIWRDSRVKPFLLLRG